MILAAGLGTRLAPITQYLPKPLFPVLNTPNLFRIIHQLKTAGFKDIIINSFHLAHALTKALKPFNIKVIREKKLLGTGGGIRNAIPLFDKSQPLLVINGDVVTDLSLRLIFQIHAENQPIASMVLHDCHPYNKVHVEGNRVTSIGECDDAPFAFTGISVLGPEFMKYLPAKTPSSLIKAFIKAIEDRKQILPIFVNDMADAYIWEDMGSIQGYLSAHEKLIKKEGKPLVVHESSILPSDFKCRDWACVGKRVFIGEGVTLKRCIIWDDCKVKKGTTLTNQAVTPFGSLKARISTLD